MRPEALDLQPTPTGKTISKTDAAMAASDRRECPFCYSPIDEEGFCTNQECR